MKKNYFNRKSTIAILSMFIMLLSFAPKANAQSFSQDFEDFTTLTDWWVTNNSDNAGLVGWFRGMPTSFPAQAGSDSSYVACNYQSDSSTTVAGTISNWLFTPNRIFNNGDVITFYTRTMLGGTYPDRLQVRLSTNGTSMNVGATSATVGDFTTLLQDINPTLITTGYPTTWTLYTITISGLAGPTSGRVAFRYYVTNAGGAGLNSWYIGIDTYSYTSNTSTSDATVSNVYTLGTIARPYGNPHQVSANITNTGTAALTNKVVTLNVTGANTFTNTQTISSLAVGASTVVTFAGYTSNNSGTNTVTVSVPADAIATGNSIAVTQTVNTSSYNYAYGATATSGVGFNGNTGDIAAKFNTSSATTISSVNVNNFAAGHSCNLKIWDATGAGGTPGSILYTSSNFTTIAGITPITVSPAVSVNGGFFVGLTQVDTFNMEIAYQDEIPVRSGVFFGQAPTGSGTWFDLSPGADFKIMIEPVFGCSAPNAPGAVSGTASVCQGSTNTYSVSAVSGATSYTWTLPGGWSGSSSTNSISATAGASGGTISVTATNGCGTSSSSSFPVTIAATPAQPGAITGTATVCQTSNQTYSISAVSGATSYTWTLPSGWSGSSTSTSISSTVGANSGSITVAANNACGSGTAQTFNVTVNQVPAQPTAISGNATVCAGTSQTYSVTAVSGANANGYIWTMPSGWTGASSFNFISATPGTSGPITVTASNSCGNSTPQVINVTVSPTPAQPGAISGNVTFCPGQAGSYSVNPVSGATTYNWNLPSGWSGTSSTNTINTTAGNTGGVISVTTTNACGTSAAQTLNVNLGTSPAQPGSISGNASVCSGITQTYSVSAVAGATSYLWTVPSGWAGASTTNAITTIPSSTGGIVSVVAINDCGTSSAQLINVVVNSAPAQPTIINGNASVCAGISGVYSIGPVSGATTYTWTLPSGWSGTSTTPSITTTPGASSGTIYVTVTNSCGVSPAQSLNVTSSAAAPSTPGSIIGNSTVCSSSSQTFTVNSVANATSYIWNLPSGWSGTSTTNSITYTVGTTGGTVTVAAQNGCGTSSAQNTAVSVNQSPNTPGTIAGSTSVCAGTTQGYFITLVSGATSYTWTLPSGWLGSSSSTSISTTAGASGTISVTANNALCSSPAQTLAVTVNTVPTAPANISGSTTVCSGSNETYTAASVAGASSYVWTLPSGWSGSSTTASITASVGTTGGTISVTASNSCGTSSATNYGVSVSVPPAQPSSITGNTNVCLGANETYSIASVSGATSYVWTLPSGWSGSSNSTSITATTGTGGGIISVNGMNGACAGPAQLLTVIFTTAPATPGTISGPTSVCAGSTNTYYVAPVANANTYTWTTPAGFTGTSTNDSITVVAGTNSGSISIVAVGTCGTSASNAASITVNALPSTPTITPSGNILSSSAATGNQWSLNGSPISGATAQFYTMTGAGFYTVTVTNANGCSATSAVFNNTGISESELSNLFTMFPNPTQDVVSITVNTDKTIESATITNVLGKVVKTINAKSFKATSTLTVEVKDLSSGIYFVSLDIEGQMVSKKLIVE